MDGKKTMVDSMNRVGCQKVGVTRRIERRGGTHVRFTSFFLCASTPGFRFAFNGRFSGYLNGRRNRVLEYESTVTYRLGSLVVKAPF